MNYVVRLGRHQFACINNTVIWRRGYASARQEAYLEPFISHPGVVALRLNRPQAKNAISVNLLKQFHECLLNVREGKSRVVIIASSSPGSFCAGADLVERRMMTQAQVDKFLADLRAGLHLLENLDIPTIAAIDGPALGGGLELALACDLRVAGFGATKIGLPETKLGIIPGAGGTQRLVRLLGLSKAKDLIFTGRAMTGKQAEEIGLVDYVADNAIDRALELASEMTTGAPLALRAAKLAISRAPELSLESGLDFERACYQPLLSTKDRAEALEAFKAKRKPIFQGE